MLIYSSLQILDFTSHETEMLRMARQSVREKSRPNLSAVLRKIKNSEFLSKSKCLATSDGNEGVHPLETLDEAPLDLVAQGTSPGKMRRDRRWRERLGLP